MSEISGGSESDRVEQAQPVDGPVDELAEAMRPELSPLAGDGPAGVEADPADVAEQQAEVPVTEDVLHDTEAAGEASS